MLLQLSAFELDMDNCVLSQFLDTYDNPENLTSNQNFHYQWNFLLCGTFVLTTFLLYFYFLYYSIYVLVLLIQEGLGVTKVMTLRNRGHCFNFYFLVAQVFSREIHLADKI